MDWKVKRLPAECCDECGQEYNVSYRNLPEKDEDSFVCFCGNVIRSWRETGCYIYSPVEDV